MAKYSVSISAESYKDATMAMEAAMQRIEEEHERRVKAARMNLQEAVESRIEELLDNLGYTVQTLNDNDLINYHMAVSAIYKICVKDLKVD